MAALTLGDIVFVAGENQAGTAGLAVYSRDPATAALALVGTYDYHALGLRSVAALAASPDQKFLYAFGEGSLAGGLVAILGLGPDGRPLPGSSPAASSPPSTRRATWSSALTATTSTSAPTSASWSATATPRPAS